MINEPKRQVRMADVARRAGVSSTTVSIVINNAPTANIPEETRERIWTAVKELGYRPNMAARAIRTHRTSTIGLVTDRIALEPHSGNLVRGVQDAARANNKLVLLFNTEEDPVETEAVIELLLTRRVEGIIYAADHHVEVNPPANLREVPAVLCDCFCTDRSLPSVVPDECGGGRTATEALLRAGHRRIGFINVAPPLPAAAGRLQGYRAALAAYGVAYDESLVVYGNTCADDGYSYTMALMHGAEPPTAIFAGTDRTAMGVYDALRDLNLSVPHDIGVVGFDNQEVIAKYLRPPLTTVALPHYAMGRWAVEYLLAALERDDYEHDTPAVQYLAPCPLIERQSI